jgi:hypothetical protein
MRSARNSSRGVRADARAARASVNALSGSTVSACSARPSKATLESASGAGASGRTREGSGWPSTARAEANSDNASRARMPREHRTSLRWQRASCAAAFPGCLTFHAGTGTGARFGGSRRTGSGAIGSSKLNVAPCPGTESTITWPPWSEMISRTIERPRPLEISPPVGRAESFSNGWKMRT